MGQVVSLSQSLTHLCLCHPVKCVMTILPSSLLPRAQAKTEKETVEPERGEMCHSMNNSPPSPPNHVKIRTRSISMMKIVKEEQEEEERETRPKNAPLKPKYASRKSRCRRRRKPKYLSLRSSRLSAPNDAAFASSSSAAATADDMDSKVRNTSAAAATTTTTAAATTKKTAVRRGEQLKLFPLQTEENAAATAEADHHSDENVALLFESDGGATLHGVLTSATDNAAATTTTTSTMSSDHDQAVESSDYGYGRRSDVDIVRTAMRGTSGGGDPGVEKWICYSELVKEEVEQTAAAATSSASTCCSVGDDRKSCSKQDQRLTLKLDYTEVLNAWSDKGSLYVKTDNGEEPPQTVPELLQDQLLHHLNDSTANIEDLWMVPEGVGSGSGTLHRKLQREASLLRYKRKRESRLFSKRIRYEVRKINAEKRPRIKGRFVRSSERQDVGHRSY